MKRDSIFIIFLKGAGMMLFGNILGGIMIFAAAPVLNEWFIPYIAVLLTVFIYGCLLFTAGWRDGQKEAKMLRNHRVESIPKYRWIWLGLALAAVMCIPCGLMLLGSLGILDLPGEFLFAFRFICGAVAPGMYIAGLQAVPVSEYPMIFPLALMGAYAVITPASAQLGYKFGIDEKNFKDFMYEKK